MTRFFADAFATVVMGALLLASLAACAGGVLGLVLWTVGKVLS